MDKKNVLAIALLLITFAATDSTLAQTSSLPKNDAAKSSKANEPTQPNPDDFIELLLDTSSDPPAVLGRTSLGRGRRAVTTERPMRPGTPIAQLTESDVLDFVLAELPTFLMARRIQTLGWVFSRSETAHAQRQREARLRSTPPATREFLAWAGANPP